MDIIIFSLLFKLKIRSIVLELPSTCAVTLCQTESQRMRKSTLLLSQVKDNRENVDNKNPLRKFHLIFRKE